MMLEEIFENGVSMVKTVWQKRGDHVSRREVKRMLATDIQPRSYQPKDQQDAG